MHQWLSTLVAPLVALLLVPSSPVETPRTGKAPPHVHVVFDDRTQRDAFDNKTDDQNDDAGRYYPLKVGNSWHYKTGDTKLEMRVARFEKIAGQTCARLEMCVQDKVQAIEHVAWKDGAVYRYGFEGKHAEPAVKFLDRPDQPGHTWEVKSTIAQEKITGTFKIGKVEKVTVAAGTFHNVVTSSSDNLDANGQKLGTTYYFARDVGMIKQTIKIGAQEITIELEKFEPAGTNVPPDRRPAD